MIYEGQAGGGVWFLLGNNLCGVCEAGLRVRLGLNSGCIHEVCVGRSKCVRVCVFVVLSE